MEANFSNHTDAFLLSSTYTDQRDMSQIGQSKRHQACLKMSFYKAFLVKFTS